MLDMPCVRTTHQSHRLQVLDLFFTPIYGILYIIYIIHMIYHILGKTSHKKIDFFRARKGGGSALPEIFDPFFHHVVPYILTSISCYNIKMTKKYHINVILFGHFNTKIIKSTKIIITIITHIIVVIIVTWFCKTR